MKNEEKMIYQKIIKAPIGDICILEENNKIIGLTLDNEKYCYTEKNTEILNETEKQLNEYFWGERKKFNVPINPKGTEFQKQVWNELLKIPYGQTVTYKRIAQKIEKPNAARAVGMANHNNPIAIIVPCHRVVGSNSKLVGYAFGLEKKQFLLDLENKFK